MSLECKYRICNYRVYIDKFIREIIGLIVFTTIPILRYKIEFVVLSHICHEDNYRFI